MTGMKIDSCPVCGKKAGEAFLKTRDLPVHIGVQYEDPAQAIACARGSLSLVFCERCLHVFNSDFDPALLPYSKYENPLSYSPFFQDFVKRKALRLIESYDIRNKTVIEVGCGKGEFLSLLSFLGENQAIGFDPSFEGELPNAGVAGRVEVIQDFYSEKYAHMKGDLICARHVLEHISELRPFLCAIRKALRQEGIFYVEVPNLCFILEKSSIGDLIFEHVSYFSPESLSWALREAGFKPLRVEEDYGGQFLCTEAGSQCVEARGQKGFELVSERVRLEYLERISRFSEDFSRKLQFWQNLLEDASAKGYRTVLWGAGAKGVSFLNLLPQGGVIEAVVDINPKKQGLYLPGTGHRIVGPSELQNLKPDLILISNPNYLSEIQKQVSVLGIRSKFQVL